MGNKSRGDYNMGRRHAELEEDNVPVVNQDARRLESWRIDKFFDLGFDEDLTELLLTWGVDYRYATRLINAGCTHETFMEIVRPA
jgi:hypothetical protein